MRFTNTCIIHICSLCILNLTNWVSTARLKINLTTIDQKVSCCGQKVSRYNATLFGRFTQKCLDITRHFLVVLPNSVSILSRFKLITIEMNFMRHLSRHLSRRFTRHFSRQLSRCFTRHFYVVDQKIDQKVTTFGSANLGRSCEVNFKTRCTCICAKLKRVSYHRFPIGSMVR